ncbi:hypothetical protein FNH22_24400 [Fulvivirga sp. M361]|uniref:hypothetical protein n=1 Tax=Fulvivirga sp. M361 TaxID=2594266 RepID=UPI0011799B1A|nr:hypothetical protein [Fulvivirga sp. M361]TRX51280.1 hypothetical protein FNH22_24400 [Fulvivirga sp. M361]
MGLRKIRFKEWDIQDISKISIDSEAISMIIQHVYDFKVEIKEAPSAKVIFDDGDEEYHHLGDPFEYAAKNSAMEIMNNAVFISSFTYLETKMRLLCQLLNPNQGKGNIQKYKNYLCKNDQIDFRHLQSDWKKILNYSFLRHKIVHDHTNKVDLKSEKEIFDKIYSLPKIQFTEYYGFAYFHISSKDFLYEFLTIINRFLDGLIYMDCPIKK